MKLLVLLLACFLSGRASTATDIDCTFLPDGNYKIEGVCETYYECANGILYERNCAEGTVFNEKTGRCDHSYNVYECMEPEAQKCVDENGNWLDIKFRVPGSCTEYYTCAGGAFQKITCPSGLFFNPDKGVCDHESSSPICIPGTTTPSNSISKTTTTITSTTTTDNTPLTTTTSTTTDNNPLTTTTDNNPLTTTTSTTTTENKPITADPVERCVDEHGDPTDVKFRVPGSCTEYFYCVNGAVYKQSCPAGTVFNPDLGYCDYEYNSPECIPDTTTHTTTSIDGSSSTTTVSTDKTTTLTTTEDLTTSTATTKTTTTSKNPTHTTTTTTTKPINPTTPTTTKTTTTPKNPTNSTTTKPIIPTTPATTTTKTTTTSKNPTHTTTTTTTKPINPTTPTTTTTKTTTTKTTTTSKNPTHTTTTTTKKPINPTTPTTTKTTTKTTTTPKNPTNSTTTTTTKPINPTTPTTATKTTTTSKTHSNTTITTTSTNTSPTTPTTTTTTSTTTSKPKGPSYIGFVVDDTGSMKNEIEAVKLWLTNCIDGSYDACANAPTGGWLIGTFNDPYVGAVLGPTTNINEIIDYIDGLSAHGGGDCPEYAMGGLTNVVNEVPDFNSGCKIFFFTDATAKDDYMESSTIALYEKKGCTFLPWLTGCCGVCEDPCISLDPEYCINHVTDNTDKDEIKKRSIDELDSYSSSPGERIYYDLASKTEGSIVLSDKPSSPEDMLEEMEEELTLGFCPTELIAGPPPLGYESESDCNSTGSCWDRSLTKCFCASETEPCPKDPINHVSCDVETVSAFYAVPNDCTSYYECSFGNMWLRPCPNGTVFDTKITLCNHVWATAPPCGTHTEEDIE